MIFVPARYQVEIKQREKTPSWLTDIALLTFLPGEEINCDFTVQRFTFQPDSGGSTADWEINGM